MDEATVNRKVVAESEQTLLKTLIVTFDKNNEPSFDFIGEGWMGKDVNLIIRLLRRRYWSRQVERRRQDKRGGKDSA